MADIYVDASVGGPGTGTSGDPYQSLQTGIDNASAGDVIHIANTSAVVLSSGLSFVSGFTGPTSADAPR